MVRCRLCEKKFGIAAIYLTNCGESSYFQELIENRIAQKEVEIISILVGPWSNKSEMWLGP